MVLRLTEMVYDLGRKVERLEEQQLADRTSFRSFRGRVYADKRWSDPAEAPTGTDLSDPRLTKAQVKAALAARGLLKPRSEPTN